MAVNGGKTPHWHPVPAKVKPAKARKKPKAKKRKKATQIRSHDGNETTSIGIASSLLRKWRDWSYAEVRLRFIQDVNNTGVLRAGLQGDPKDLQEELDLLLVHVPKVERAFRSIEREMQTGALAGLDLDTQLSGKQTRRKPLCLLDDLRPKKRMRSKASKPSSPAKA